MNNSVRRTRSGIRLPDIFPDMSQMGAREAYAAALKTLNTDEAAQAVIHKSQRGRMALHVIQYEIEPTPENVQVCHEIAKEIGLEK